MDMRLRARLGVLVLGVLVTGAVAAAPVDPVSAADPPIVYPDSIAAIGDSISAGTGTVLTGFEAPWNSFSTGTTASVDSLYSRILAVNPAIAGNNVTIARNGARMDDFAVQAAEAVAADVAFVTVLLGGNDLCRDSLAEMTPTETYRAEYRAGMDLLAAGLPDARVLTISVPDVYLLWELFHDDWWPANVIWPVVPCQSLLADPQSTAPADVARRDAVRTRNVEYNTVLAEECASYRICRFDGGGLFDSVFAKNDISSWDYFHPSLDGHTKLAAGLWPLVGEPSGPLPRILPGHALVNPEGDAGSTVVQLPVTLSAPSPFPVTVRWSTVDQPENPAVAISGSDHVAAAGHLTFAPGETAKTVSIEILGDTVDEPPLLYGEWGIVAFSDPTGAVIDTSFFGLSIFIIIDDD